MLEKIGLPWEEKLVYVIPPEGRNPETVRQLLAEHPEIKFVSMVGIDLGGNDTDEKIPISLFIREIDEFLNGSIQTDGSSVVLPGIASINNAKVDFIADTSVNWTIDYNYEHIDPKTGLPVGTLRIPSFLVHDEEKVGSRSVLLRAQENVKKCLMKYLLENPSFARQMGINPEEVEDVVLTAATELEFWVKTPGDRADIDQLTVSQVLQEQYWKRTKGDVRTALEKSLMLLERYGLNPEMGHKEVGGVTAQLSGEGRFSHVMEQIEVDWKYSNPLQAADNELRARIVIKETFRLHGLEVTFMPKPIEGVAGNGEHTHVGIALKMKDGTIRNLFTPLDPGKDYLSPAGWGALMGLLKNYEAVGTFITCFNNAFNRLKPGFEAPVCINASIGHSVDMPSRNRTVLVGLIRDKKNPLATRFEVRSPNPHTNTYLALAAIYQSMLDGIRYAAKSGKSSKELEKEFSKKPGEESQYLEKDRAYRSEEDVFEYYTPEERNRLFGVPPATVWEALQNLNRFPEKTEVLKKGNVLCQKLIDSYVQAMVHRWTMELRDRIIPENMEFVRSCVPLHYNEEDNSLDRECWERIHQLKLYLLKDAAGRKSLFSMIRTAIAQKDYRTVSRLQQEMSSKIDELKSMYAEYKRNIINHR
jgi:glutamine synthetase